MMQENAPYPGEEVLSEEPTPLARIVGIGRLVTPFEARADCPHQGDPETGPECRAEIDAAFVPALRGVAAPGWVDLLYWLHEARRDVLVQARKSAPTGTFALRSPVRPNPIGVSRVRVLWIEGAVIGLRGLDCVSGTPLIDIKPARCPLVGASDA